MSLLGATPSTHFKSHPRSRIECPRGHMVISPAIGMIGKMVEIALLVDQGVRLEHRMPREVP